MVKTHGQFMTDINANDGGMLSNATRNDITVEEDALNTAKPILDISGWQTKQLRQNLSIKALISHFVKIRVILLSNDL